MRGHKQEIKKRLTLNDKVPETSIEKRLKHQVLQEYIL